MKKVRLVLAVVWGVTAISTGVSAACVGGPVFYTCTDGSGNQ